MGVHGLRGFLRRSGIDGRNDEAIASNITLSPNSTTLAIDGSGLIFHLFRLAYRRHRQDVLASSSSFASSSNEHYKSLQTQLLLPSLTPLSLAHDVTTTYLSELTTKHGLHLQIYFDGPDQHMKRREKQRRGGRREDEWENTRQLCIHGILPGENVASKFRSSARRQVREYDQSCSNNLDGAEDNNDNGDDEAEVYLGAFPMSPLVMDQIKRSVEAFADMSTVLPFGSVQVIQCDGEADAMVARASAKDAMGMTYVLANDTDYLIYGSNEEHYGETKYIQFHQIDPSADSPCVGTVLTRSHVAASIGLPLPRAMIDFSILLGNDYTGPFVKDDDLKKRKECWESIRWYRDGGEMSAESDGCERLPSEDELGWYDTQGIADHVAEKVGDGWKLTSVIPELQCAIQFSYELYSFGDISKFPSTAPASTVEEETLDEEGGDEEIAIFPSLPRGFVRTPWPQLRNTMDLAEAALLPLTSYISDFAAESGALQFIEQRHLDAFRMTLKRVKNQNEQVIESPQRKMLWADVQALYILEKCLLEAISESAGVENMPCLVFSHSIFHSCLESISFEDFPLDNELVSKDEKAFLEEATNEFPAGKDKEPVTNRVLPIDKHKEEILHTVETQRVTIIHGETGCGKSSRVPCFLLRADPPEPTFAAPEVKMIVSQPRRIAAKALAERVRSCEPDIADQIALRMGHGIREYETSKTRAWFVTTGYVVRLLANHPSWFDSHTHLIIDEVHERSIDTDILCLLCRRLLVSHPTIRLVLMSATMAAELYSQYFGAPQPPIHVGSRCFPIKEYFVEDLKSLLLSSKSAKIARGVYDECEKSKCRSAPAASTMEKLHHLATQITASVGSLGSAVLIFVPGMSDIEAIIELVEKLNSPGVAFICLPIHSDVPFEEQMAAFEPPKEGEVKVIIATNAAESSLTLPDVDHVICLGLCKQIEYNKESHRQILMPTWISRASATQRAGRTGRVREGSVYRLYSRNAFQKYMQPFDQGELVRSPLDNTILSLRDMLDEAVTPILLECLEPPDISTIERSFQSLHASNFISDPTDEGAITSLGSLVVALGIDLTLGAFVGLGIQFGVAAEAIQLAAILSFPKTPWAISSPMYHDTDTFNEIVSKTFVSRCFFDAGLFSEPMAISNLLHDYSNCQDRNQFCWKHRVSATRMRHLYGTVDSLKRRVADRLSVRTEVLSTDTPPYLMHHAKLNILRILQVWLFHDTMIVHDPSKSRIKSSGGAISIKLDGPPIRRDHLAQILNVDHHSFEISSSGKIGQQGTFESTLRFLEDRADFFKSWEIRFISYVLEKKIDFSFYLVGTSLNIIVPADIWDIPESKLRESIIGTIPVNIREVWLLQNTGGGNQRGRRGRACGAWHPSSIDSVLSSEGILPMKRVYILSSHLPKSQIKSFKRFVDKDIADKIDSIKSILSCSITEGKMNAHFSMASSGECHEISETDLRDLFASPDLVANLSTSTLRQSVNFPRVEGNASEHDSSNPLIEDAPEGARLMSVLASERRRDNFIRFSDGAIENFIDVNLPKEFSINGQKWKRKGGGGMVFVPENCVPVAAIPANNSPELFGCCANTLDLRGGACRVEGITMLPPGRLFVGLAFLSFGVNPKTGSPIDSGLDFLHVNEYTDEEKKEAGGVNNVVQEALSWINEKDKRSYVQHEHWRVVDALDFHTACMELGETLECQPDKIKALCQLFDGVNGHAMTVWDGYDISLGVASASCRPKPMGKTGNRHTNTNNELKPIESTADNRVASNKKEHPCPTKQDAPKSMAKNEPYSKPTFACLECNKIFLMWNVCVRHRDECCPGTRLSRKKAIALAHVLETNNSSVTPLLASRSKDEINKAVSSDHTKKGNVASKMMWMCPSCKEIFPEKKKCDKHIKLCSFGLVKQTNPKKVSVCNGCNEMFETSNKFRAHKKGCCRGGTATGSEEKGEIEESLDAEVGPDVQLKNAKTTEKKQQRRARQKEKRANEKAAAAKGNVKECEELEKKKIQEEDVGNTIAGNLDAFWQAALDTELDAGANLAA
mmetsp:Transcript_8856/g.19868  ORF Transcript_8856/g.19868 Transcript_8856/m.19868 type:complete len:2027 (-) Transcript_8856:217-6297(-)